MLNTSISTLRREMAHLKEERVIRREGSRKNEWWVILGKK